jgi:transposase-like protein
MKCPNCGSESLVKCGYNKSGSQRYKCTGCGRITTPDAKQRGYDSKTRSMAVRMVLEGNSFASASRILEVNAQSVSNWVKAHVDALPEEPAKPTEIPDQIEVDELFTFIGSKRTRPISSRRSSGKPGVS